MEASALAECVAMAKEQGWNGGLMGWKHGPVRMGKWNSACGFAHSADSAVFHGDRVEPNVSAMRRSHAHGASTLL